MDKNQRKYAMDRVVQIANNKADAIKSKHTVPAITLTNQEKRELVASGKLMLGDSAEALKLLSQFENA